MIVMEKLDHLVVVEDLNAALLGGSKERLHEAGAARETIAQHSAGTAETGIRHGLDLAELHAFLFEPVDAFGDVVRIGAVKGLITHLLRNIHHHGVEGFSRIFNTLLLLMTRTPAANRAQRVNGIAVRTVAFFKEHHLGAQVVGGDGGDQACGTRAHDDRVINRGFLAGLGFSSRGDSGHTGGGSAEERGLQKTTAAHIHVGHCFLLLKQSGLTAGPKAVGQRQPSINMGGGVLRSGL